MKVILPASEIPLLEKVTKRTGEKQYTLRDRIRVFSEHGSPQEIAAQDGCRFLVDDKGDANAIPGSLELVWLADVEYLRNFILP